MEQNVIIGVRFPIKDRDLLRQVCKYRGEDMSSFIRRAVKREIAELGYYSKETTKALGVKVKVQK